MKSALLALIVVAAWFSLQSALAQSRPANDDFAQADDLGNGNMPILSGPFAGATVEPSEPTPPGSVASVWYKVTPSVPRILFVEASYRGRTTSTDSTLSLFESHGQGFASLTPLTISRAGTPLLFGHTYYISISSAQTVSDFFFPLTLKADRPVNDDFANAQFIGSDTDLVIEGSAEGATREPGEPYSPGGVSSVWYKWIPQKSGRVSIRTSYFDQHSQFSLFLAQGNSFADLVEIGHEGDLTAITAGNTYFIGVFDRLGTSFPFGYNLTEITTPSGPGPSNDNFQNAQVLQGETFSIVGSNSGATREPFEPLGDNDSAGASVWYSWTPTFVGRGYISSSTRFNSLKIAIYEGSNLSNLQRVNSRPFDFQPGHTYYFQIDTPANGVEEQNFGLSMTTSPFIQANDNFANAEPLFNYASWLQIGHAFMNYATRESGEPDHVAYPFKSVWWRFDPAEDGIVAVRSRSWTPQARVTIAIYQGNQIDQLSLIAKGESFYLNVTQGQTLWVAPVVPIDGTEEVFCDFESTSSAPSGTPQSVQWDTLPNVELGSGPVTLNATTTSGLPVRYELFTVMGSAQAHLTGNVLTFDTAGLVVVKATTFSSMTLIARISSKRWRRRA